MQPSYLSLFLLMNAVQVKLNELLNTEGGISKSKVSISFIYTNLLLNVDLHVMDLSLLGHSVFFKQVPFGFRKSYYFCKWWQVQWLPTVLPFYLS